jgi:hypothetical protein
MAAPAKARKPYNTGIQQRHRPRTTATSRQRTATCPNEHQRPRCQEFASRGSGVPIPSVPPQLHPGQRPVRTPDRPAEEQQPHQLVSPLLAPPGVCQRGEQRVRGPWTRLTGGQLHDPAEGSAPPRTAPGGVRPAGQTLAATASGALACHCQAGLGPLFRVRRPGLFRFSITVNASWTPAISAAPAVPRNIPATKARVLSWDCALESVALTGSTFPALANGSFHATSFMSSAPRLRSSYGWLC